MLWIFGGDYIDAAMVGYSVVALMLLLRIISLDSINATSSAIVKYVSQRAGIGINAGRIRALGSPMNITNDPYMAIVMGIDFLIACRWHGFTL